MSMVSSSTTGGARRSFDQSSLLVEASSHVPKKRPRPVLSCIECRTKKLKCDRLLPCNQCRRANKTTQCVYQNRDSSQTQPQTHVSDGSESEFAPSRKKISGVRQVPPLAPRDSTSSQIPTPLVDYDGKHGLLEELQSRVEKLERTVSVHLQSHTLEVSQVFFRIFVFIFFFFLLHRGFP